jgi:hypothetical protein
MIGTKQLGQAACQARLRARFFITADLVTWLVKVIAVFAPQIQGRVAPGDCSPRAPTDPYVPSRAYGSSRHELAAGRYTEWTAIGGGSGYRSNNR